MLFGRSHDLELCWLPPVPQGAVTATYSIGGVSTSTTGIGHRDHSRGNAGLRDIVHDWYRARGQAGPISVITSDITAVEKYGCDQIPIVMLARDGQIVADGSGRVTFETEDVCTDDRTGKPVAGTTRSTDDDGPDRYVVTFVRADPDGRLGALAQARARPPGAVRRRLPAVHRVVHRDAPARRPAGRGARRPRRLGAHALGHAR